MYGVIFSDNAYKGLKKLERTTQKRIVAVLERIRIRPQHHVKKLVGSPYYRLRIGEYRAILDINQGQLIILVIEIAHRERIYK